LLLDLNLSPFRWCLHWAPPNFSEEDRIAYTVSFVADGVKLLAEDKLNSPDAEDAPSYEDWIGDLTAGEKAKHPMLPIVGE